MVQCMIQKNISSVKSNTCLDESNTKKQKHVKAIKK